MLKPLIDKAAFPLLVIDQTGRIQYANRGAEIITGYRRRELEAFALQDLCATYEKDRFIFSNLARIKDLAEIEIDLRKKGGRQFMANISFAPLVHEENRFLLIALRDVTARRVREGQIRELEERYRKLLAERNRLEDQVTRSTKLAAIGELAAGIAHEINNPLGIILGFAQDILEEIPPDHPFFESVKIIEQETARCSEVVKNLLDFARLRPPQMAAVDISRLLNDSVVLLKPKLAKNKIQVKRIIPKRVPLMKVDPQLIQQAVLNVMLNAIQAMPYGGDLSLRIKLTNHESSGTKAPRIKILIADTGPGIPDEIQNRIFDPFFTTKGSKGTGLGLSVCQRIIEDHGGRVEVESREKTGTTLILNLPV
ncbi:MAG: PAS domain-containing protein [Deltaproteobacteria bacterium]|nr:PAS domain-containing protein [Deltaproteobacteria bacterium]